MRKTNVRRHPRRIKGRVTTVTRHERKVPTTAQKPPRMQPQKMSPKQMRVTLTSDQQNAVFRQMQPLILKGIIKSYNVVEDYDFAKTKKFQLVYSDDTLRKHADIIMEELDDRGVNYYLVPMRTYARKGKGKRKYQLVADMDGKELEEFIGWLQPKVTDKHELITMVDGFINPTVSSWEVLPMTGAEEVPDLRIRGKRRQLGFSKAKKFVKPIDKDTNLVVLAVTPSKISFLRRRLKGETEKDILVQDQNPKRYSQAERLR